MNTRSNPKGTALITGASAGMGALYADRLARRGHDLILVARDQKRLEALAARITQETGRSVDVVVADLTVKADLQRVEERLRSDAAISVLVNNAGFGSTATLVDSDVDQLESMIALNVTALMRLSRAVAPAFVARGAGTIVNIASMVSLWPEVLNGTYSGTKAFVVNFTQSLHHELSGKGVQVQAVLPGATRTDFWNTAGTPVAHLPQEIVMGAEELVDAALAGLDQRELITIPSLPDVAEWDAFNAARVAMQPKLSGTHAAARYKQAAPAKA
jgi:short-subunit dehydrogenase